MMHHPLRLFRVLVLVAVASPWASTTTSSSTDSNSGSSTVLLDNYGNAVQLRHAQNAAQQQGSLVLVVRRGDGAFWVVSLVEDESEALLLADDDNNNARRQAVSFLRPSSSMARDDDDDSSLPLQLGTPYRGATRFLHPLVSSFSHSFQDDDNDDDNGPTTSGGGGRMALVTVGVQGDAQWLLDRMQTYLTLVWDRTHQAPAPMDAVVTALSALVRQCALRYPKLPAGPFYSTSLEQLLHPKRNDENDDDDDDATWSRPLGVCTLLLRQQQQGEDQGLVFRIDPSGLVTHVLAPHDDNRIGLVCLGKRSKELQQWWDNDDTVKGKDPASFTPLADVELLQRIGQGLAHVLGGRDKLPRFLRLETLSQDGRVQRRLVALREDVVRDA